MLMAGPDPVVRPRAIPPTMIWMLIAFPPTMIWMLIATMIWMLNSHSTNNDLDADRPIDQDELLDYVDQGP